MFAATLPQELDGPLKDLFGASPRKIRTRGSQQLVATLDTDNRQIINGRRFDELKRVLAADPQVGTLLFANTRQQCEAIAAWLDKEGADYVSYMGQMDRLERRRNLARFRAGDVPLLIATDLGGRGLDIDRVDRVVNVHLPTDLDNYLHRVGRTARAGRSGLVVNLVTGRDQPLMAKLKARAEQRR
jgi:superfamily II DNA/RNA helicase